MKGVGIHICYISCNDVLYQALVSYMFCKFSSRVDGLRVVGC